MTVSRRKFVLMGLGAVLTGCTQTGQTTRRRAGSGYGGTHNYPYPLRNRPLTAMPRDVNYPIVMSPIPPVPHMAPPAPPASPTTSYPPSKAATLRVIPRSTWAKGPPIGRRLNPMGSFEHITIHHEGWTRVLFSDVQSTAKRLESIRKSHLDNLHAGDIGYHYVIDRAGRLWEGRSLRYQGAHVRNHNPHNIGIMVLGNFSVQHPTDVQMATLNQTLRSLIRQYRVPIQKIHTHKELMPTSCPGNSLQRSMVVLRNGRYLL